MNPFHWLFDKFYPVIRYVYESIQGHAWFDKIYSNIWMGGAPTYDRDYKFLIDENINAVLDLRAERSDDTDFLAENGIDYLRLKVLDVTVPGDTDLDSGVEFIRDHVQRENNVLIHCAKGRGRSATLAAAYLMKYEGYSYEEARDFLQSKRSLVNLQGRHRRALESWIGHQTLLTDAPESADAANFTGSKEMLRDHGEE